MKISIQMGADLSAAKNPKIILISPSKKNYQLDATIETYGAKPIAAISRTILLMSINAETNGVVEDEEGEFEVMATCEMDHYRLSSPEIKMKIEKGIASIIESDEEEEKKMKEGTGSSFVNE